MADENKKKPALQQVVMLQVDTADSRSLYATMNVFEKQQSQKLFRDNFARYCAQHGGSLHHWAGDGGLAIFPSSSVEDVAGSARSATEFLNELADMNAQAALLLKRPSFVRHIRLSAHRAEVLLDGDSQVSAGDRADFDDFIKGEKTFAPELDSFFITEKVYQTLSHADRQPFERFKEKVKYGKLTTALYRLRRAPVKRAEDIFKHGDDVKRITPAEWRYLRTQIDNHHVNVAARNEITKGLVAHLDSVRQPGNPLLPYQVLLDLTLDALVSYLKLSFKDHRFRICYWRAVDQNGVKSLIKVAHRYPVGMTAQNRAVLADDTTLKVCQAFNRARPVATPSIPADRLKGEWSDFDEGQARAKRKMLSALQLPIYVLRGESRCVMGVLSLDADTSDVFLAHELPAWIEGLVGFLANLSLAEKLRESQTGEAFGREKLMDNDSRGEP